MHIRGAVLTPLVVGAFAAASMSTAPVSARQQPPTPKPQPQQQKKLDKVQLLELQANSAAVEAVRRGQPGPDGYKLTLQTDTLKGYNNKTYVAFTAFINPEGVQPKKVTVYLHVLSKANDVIPEAAKAESKDPKAAQKAREDEQAAAKKNPAPPSAWDDLFFTEIKAPEPGQPFRFSRSFTVLPGEYNVYIAIRDTSDPKAKDKDVLSAKAGVLKAPVVVPDYWNGELSVSSVILSDSIVDLPTPYGPDEQPAHPYAFGQTEIRTLIEPKLSKTKDLTAWFYVYNPAGDANRKPNVVIEYRFFQKVAAAENGEKYFNATKPVELNAQTLPPQFDIAAGHQLPGGQAIPLASFAEGVYRLEIKVTDKISGKVLTKDVTFNVTS